MQPAVGRSSGDDDFTCPIVLGLFNYTSVKLRYGFWGKMSDKKNPESPVVLTVVSVTNIKCVAAKPDSVKSSQIIGPILLSCTQITYLASINHLKAV